MIRVSLLFILVPVFILFEFAFAQEMHPLYKSASAKYQSKDYKGARADCIQLLKAQPDHEGALYIKAYAEYELGELNTALADVQLLVKKNPDYDGYKYLRGLVFMAQYQYKKAADEFTVIVNASKINWRSYVKRSISRYHLKDYKGTIEDIDKAISICKDCEAQIMAEVSAIKKDALEKLKESNVSTGNVTPVANSSMVTDIDGNIYRTIRVANFLVMDENLRVTRYQNGDELLPTKEDNAWVGAFNEQKGAFGYFNNDMNTAKKAGALYNYYAVQDGRNICPKGWRVPTNAEWEKIAGEIRSKRSVIPCWYTLPEYIFRFSVGSYERRDGYGSLWSASPYVSANAAYADYDKDKAWEINFANLMDPVKQSRKRLGLCVRCITDAAIPAEQTVVDIDGNRYKIAGIGKQYWMAEDLKTTRLNDGTPLSAGKNDAPSYSSANGTSYNFWAVNTQKLCPAGWKVPSVSDWNELIDFYGGEKVAGSRLVANSSLMLQNEFMPKYSGRELNYFWTADLCGNKISAETKLIKPADCEVKRDCKFLNEYLPVRCIKGETPVAIQKPTTNEEWSKQWSKDTYIPRSGRPMPEKWAYKMKDVNSLITGYYTKVGCGCDVQPFKDSLIAIYCYASNWSGKMKDLSKAAATAKDYYGRHKIENIRYLSFNNTYVINLNNGIYLTYYPEKEKLTMKIDMYEIEWSEKEIFRKKEIREILEGVK
jgi:uncharacterized protein (TIGR02145 family)